MNSNLSDTPFAGECYCYPKADSGNCAHCNRARMYIEREIYCRANALGELMLKDNIDDLEIDNLWVPMCAECGDTNLVEGEIAGNAISHCVGCGELKYAEDITESEPQEIFQWYIVSNFLARNLCEIGEPVASWKNQCWWGRTCCGQAIELDGTFQKISRKQGD